MGGVADPDQLGSDLENKVSDEIEVSTPAAVEEAVKNTGGEETEEKNLSESGIEAQMSEVEQVNEDTKETENERSNEEVSGTQPEVNVEVEPREEKEIVTEAESAETQKIKAAAENGDQGIDPDHGIGKISEAADDDADDTTPSSPKRRKLEEITVGREVARKRKQPKRPPRHPERVEWLKNMNTLEDMKKLLAEHGKSEADYKVGDVIEVDDLIQTDYEYKLEALIGKDFAEGFNPSFSPKEMLALGIFEGQIINDCILEFPKEWFEEAIEKGKLALEEPDESKNRFQVKSRFPSKEWHKRGWLPKADPRGWFQWYCRYYLGRRLEQDDAHQMSRWRQLNRHAGQVKKYCQPGDLSCRVKQRQTLLNWSHDCFV